MRQPDRLLATNYSDHAVCVGVSLGVHLLLLLWNPTILRGNVLPPHNPLVSIDMIIDAPSPGGSSPEAPKKMSIMDTLKTMLMTPKVEQIPHIAVQPPATRVAAPILQERTMPRPIATQFQPKSQTQDLASMAAANQIDVKGPNLQAKPAEPSLTSKSFGGIRAKELPFQVGTDQGLTGGGPAVPIAVGNRSAKEALNYASPTLSEKSAPRMGIRPTSASSVGSINSIGTGAPSTIALSGTGGTGNAPTGATSGSVLTERAATPGFGRSGTGGSGTGRGSSFGSGIEGIPSAAADLDKQLSEGGRAKKPKSVELEGPIGNRTIIRKVIPQYPAWAEEQGIIGSVRIYFTVAADGSVRSNLRVTKTTGYPNLDQLGLDALKQWRFAPAPASTDEGSQWGIITFNFSLSS